MAALYLASDAGKSRFSLYAGSRDTRCLRKTWLKILYPLFTYTKHCISVMLEGKFVNGTVLVVD
ncbi:hypothetical protein QQP08_006647 [Theobroma cacao]|nr:hypothetical protein QQP08_006647 [Theobroma cacao]